MTLKARTPARMRRKYRKPVVIDLAVERAIDDIHRAVMQAPAVRPGTAKRTLER